jgi:hypothetical protein
MIERSQPCKDLQDVLSRRNRNSSGNEVTTLKERQEGLEDWNVVRNEIVVSGKVLKLIGGIVLE